MVYGVAAAIMWPGLSLLLAGVTSAGWRVLWPGSWLAVIATAILAVARFRAWIVAAAVSAVLMARFLWPVGVTYREMSLAGRLVIGLPLPRNVLIEVGFFEVAAMTLAQVVVFVVGVVTVASVARRTWRASRKRRRAGVASAI